MAPVDETAGCENEGLTSLGFSAILIPNHHHQFSILLSYLGTTRFRLGVHYRPNRTG